MSMMLIYEFTPLDLTPLDNCISNRVNFISNGVNANDTNK